MERIEAPRRTELLNASDDEIAGMLEHADPMALRGLVYQLTGDPELVDMELSAVGAGMWRTVAPSSDADVASIRQKAAAFLKEYRDGGAADFSPGPSERLATSLALAAGTELDDDHVAWSIEELGLNPWARSLEWKDQPSAEELEQFSVTVIGTGLGGLNAAVQLKRAGIPFRVIEKNPDIGGTWHENRYPGIRVDAPSRLYTHIFGAEFDYKYPFCPGDENRRYLDWITDTFEVRDDILFDTEVRELRWDDSRSEWEISIDGEGGPTSFRSNAVITSVGFLNRPKLPEIEGMENFAGPSWHTARWPQDFDAKGKRLAVIGTGCSGYQLVPELAREAESVVVFQRRPQWLVPVPGYLSEQPAELAWLERNMPLYVNFTRFRASLVMWSLSGLAKIDPEFDDPEAANEMNREQRDASIAFLDEKLRPELSAKMLPPHPLLSARPVVVDPEYSILDCLEGDKVELVTDGISGITRNGIEDLNGQHHEVDAIVYATGFEASEYLFPMVVKGRGGRTLEEEWAQAGAMAYRGTMVPDFPNLWMLYGPNTNGGLGVPGVQEMAMYFALQCIEEMVVNGIDEISPKRSAYERWNEQIDERNLQMVWSDPRARNYYWTQAGRSATQNPLDPTEVWRSLRHPDFGELEVHQRSDAPSSLA